MNGLQCDTTTGRKPGPSTQTEESEQTAYLQPQTACLQWRPIKVCAKGVSFRQTGRVPFMLTVVCRDDAFSQCGVQALGFALVILELRLSPNGDPATDP